MSSVPSEHSSSRPPSESDRNLANPSRLSESSAFRYGSDAGTVVSGSTSISQHGTHRSRPDLGLLATSHNKTFSIEQCDDALYENIHREGQDGSTPTTRVYIWGTRICIEDVQKEFYSFISNFRTQNLDDDENAIQMGTGELVEIDLQNPHYMEKLRGINLCEIPILNINLEHIREYNESLYKMIVAYPDAVIPHLDTTINDIFLRSYNKVLPSNIEIRPYNAEQTKNMRDLNPLDIDQLITTKGMVTRISPLIPEMNRGFFECTFCNASVENMVDLGRIEEPVYCSNCGNSHCFQIIHNRAVFIDKQVIKLQEIPGDMPAGQTQHTITLYVHGSLVENVHPGDRVSVTGIYRATPMRLNPIQRTLNSVYNTSIDVIHFRKINQDRLYETIDGLYLTEERINKVIELSKHDDIIDRLVRSVAPNIFGHDEIKKGILCLLFGGSRKLGDANNRVKLRSEINLLLCGDPGTAKSQLLQYVYRLVPRSQFTSGKGSSSVGLSASVTRDYESKSVVLQPGALVLADNGVCCIDEFDKMSDSTRSILHEVMEQQTLSIAKAGIICQLNARTSVLAAANPIDSKWNKKKNIIENVHLPHTLLSRFDLIFLVLDPDDEEYDYRLAQHLVNFYLEADLEAQRQQQLDMDFLRDYIAYAKSKVSPVLTEKSTQLLIQKYQYMRSQGSSIGHISAYPRQLESLIRLAESFAKMRLSPEVSEADVEMAYDLHNEALQQSAVNPETGLVEVNIIATGFSDKHKKKVQLIADLISQELGQKKGNFSLVKLYKEIRLTNKMLDRESFDDAIKLLVQNNYVICNADRLRVIAEKTG